MWEKKLIKVTNILGGVIATASLSSLAMTSCVSSDTFPSIRPTSGLTTIKNLLSTALVPVGRTFYVWGGGWNGGQTGANQATTHIGFYQNWEFFFNKYGGDYNYQDHRYQIYDGLDCSGYVGWVVYNVFNTIDGEPGYVSSSTNMAKTFANDYGWGELINHSSGASDLSPGNIVSISGHVYIVIGQCDDGSVLLVHSSPAGVQINGTTTPSGENDSKAIILATKYMHEYYPKWDNKFGSESYTRLYATYINNTTTEMKWNLSSAYFPFSDPDNFVSKTPETILQILFNES